MSFKSEAIKYLKNYADILEFKGENRFKINAFRGATNVLRRLDADLEEMLKDGSITNVKGIGKGIQSFLLELLENGTVNEYEEQLGSIPDGILDILQIRGLGVKKAKILYEQLHISNIKDLEFACKTNRLITIKGFTEKTEEKILEEIENMRKHNKFMLINHAEHLGASIVKQLKELKSVEKVEISGELRRCLEVISKISIVVVSDNINKFKKELVSYYKYNRLDGKTSWDILSLESDSAIPIELHLTNSENFINVLLKTTGSYEFLEKLESENLSGAYKTEKEIFRELNVGYVIPEMREYEYFNAPEILRNNSDLKISEIKGLLHFHTDFSDGVNNLLQMASEAKNMGFEYLAVCDHSKSAYYANGLNEESVLKQKEEIKNVKNQIDMEIFHGIESDILKDGSLDYSEDFMLNFDFVVASIHSQFNLSEEEMTKRIITAIENPNTDVLGHPTGRLLLSRQPYKINIKKIIKACVENNVAIEINASPHRLDLDWRNYYYAREIGCKFAINPDAHSIAGIHDIKYGIMVARKGGIKMNEVINYLSLDDFKKYLNRKITRNF